MLEPEWSTKNQVVIDAALDIDLGPCKSVRLEVANNFASAELAAASASFQQYFLSIAQGICW
ncbi:hypothetical protein CERSUDRAFT_100116 [Gelatoporia subvermispora B]|uniref:Uncharacterized protein n=1 Tax=Ceriporiopsis subvermispora (strain B) TaxID=914234 RepID=M2QHT7_CERS8|nr:hypothetical protein CERSUDRAFT_100116 [Gelatoporia subvermispora B]